jgi:hypothetical protein
LDYAFDVSRLAHIAAQQCNTVPKFTCCRLQPGRTLPDDDDGSAFLPEQLRSFQPDTRSSTGNEDDFVRQFHDLSPGLKVWSS